MTQKVDVVIPVFNQLERVVETVDTLRQFTPLLGRLVLVDDASTDERIQDYIAHLRTWITNVDIVVHGENTKFSKSANDGIALTRSKYIALLNSDLVLNEGWLEKLLWVYDEHTRAIDGLPPIAVVGCVQHAENNQLVHSGYEGWAGMIHPRTDNAWECDWVTGAVWLINRDAWRSLGPLREDHDGLRDYSHFESDREWCLRAKERNWRVMCSPHVIKHYWRQSTPLDWTHT